MIYLLQKPVRAPLPGASRWQYDWDGTGTLALNRRGEVRTRLHFSPGDAVRVTVNRSGNVMLTKVTEPAALHSAVLWFIGVERDFRAPDPESYNARVERFCMTAEVGIVSDFNSVAWKPSERVSWRKREGTCLFLLEEPHLRLARLAGPNGEHWSDVAAWCDRELTPEQARELAVKYGTGNTPGWYVDKVLRNAAVPQSA